MSTSPPDKRKSKVEHAVWLEIVMIPHKFPRKAVPSFPRSVRLFPWPKKTGNERESNMAVEALYFERIYMNIFWRQSYNEDAVYVVTCVLNVVYFVWSDLDEIAAAAILETTADRSLAIPS